MLETDEDGKLTGMEWINPKNKDIKGKMVENIGKWGKFIGLGD